LSVRRDTRLCVRPTLQRPAPDRAAPRRVAPSPLRAGYLSQRVYRACGSRTLELDAGGSPHGAVLTPGGGGGGGGGGGCRMRNGEVACYYMGNVHTREWALLDEGRPEEGLKLTYKAGTSCDGRTGRSMEHHFICDPSVRPAPPPPPPDARSCARVRAPTTPRARRFRVLVRRSRSQATAAS